MSLIASGIIIIPCNPKSTYSHDKYYKYRYNSNVFYYSGITQEGTIIVLNVPENKSYLFILDQNKEEEVWDGKRLNPEEAGEKSGFMMIYPLSEFKTKIRDIFQTSSVLHYPKNVNYKLDQVIVELADEKSIEMRDPTPRFDTIRLIKDKYELELLEKSVSITVNAHLEAIQQTEVGLSENELEAIYKYHFQINGAIMPMHQATVAAGQNAIYLHHRSTNKIINPNELILVDTGSEYYGYTADVARTWPVTGTFTKSQKMIYELVLKTHKICIKMVEPGVKFWDIHNKAVDLLTEGLIEMKLLKGEKSKLIEEKKYRMFFMHSIGHFLGLDGHDCSSIDREEVTLQVGMVITIEPGLYIPLHDDIPLEFQGIGIRVEDNLIVTENGHRNLSESLPIEIDEIEDLVGSMIDN